MNELDHEKEFELAWNDPSNTRYELPPIDINAVLEERYEPDEPLIFTRTLLWDLEVRKARRPDVFIPNVVAEGSADSWGGDEVFVRRSDQRLWLAPEERGLILEQTSFDHARQTVTFIGAAELPGPGGENLVATTKQPIFHVEHGVAGEEPRPLNTWRIVHLTDAPDPRVTAVFDGIAANPWLPLYVEIYIRDVLGIGLTRRE
ncbi:hypothetical protein [Spirillospora sp. CA-294931]|uniref:hypothetical protein n=1 Tax=Spirillospora sp. CA-294931 TaxID=3240042 RepID=UPI003D90C0C1